MSQSSDADEARNQDAAVQEGVSLSPSGAALNQADACRPPENCLIVGHKGRMGKMLLAEARKHALPAHGIDKPFTSMKLKKACANADAVILCLPVKYLEDVLIELAPLLRADAILADITSVKEKPMTLMEKIYAGPVIGTHPLFGPKPGTGEERYVALTPGKNATTGDMARISCFFERIGCKVFITTAVEHDLAMAKIQNMNFITNLAYFALLAEQKELLPFLTPSFLRRKNAAAKMLTEDAEMFSGLFEANAHSHEVVRQYRRMLNVAASGDIDLLCKRANWWWQEKQPEPDKN